MELLREMHLDCFNETQITDIVRHLVYTINNMSAWNVIFEMMPYFTFLGFCLLIHQTIYPKTSRKGIFSYCLTVAVVAVFLLAGYFLIAYAIRQQKRQLEFLKKEFVSSPDYQHACFQGSHFDESINSTIARLQNDCEPRRQQRDEMTADNFATGLMIASDVKDCLQLVATTSFTGSVEAAKTVCLNAAVVKVLCAPLIEEDAKIEGGILPYGFLMTADKKIQRGILSILDLFIFLSIRLFYRWFRAVEDSPERIAGLFNSITCGCCCRNKNNARIEEILKLLKETYPDITAEQIAKAIPLLTCWVIEHMGGLNNCKNAKERFALATQYVTAMGKNLAVGLN